MDWGRYEAIDAAEAECRREKGWIRDGWRDWTE
jgi:hypothetical protein